MFYEPDTQVKPDDAISDIPLDKDRPDRTLAALAAFDASKYTVKCEKSKCTVKPASKDSPQLCYQIAGKYPTFSQNSCEEKDKSKSNDPPSVPERMLFSANPGAYCKLYRSFVPSKAERAIAETRRRLVEEAINALSFSDPPRITKILRPPTEKVWAEFKTRSVGEIIQFLGDLVALQDHLADLVKAGSTTNIHTPVTLGYCEDENLPGCADYLFRVNSGEDDARLTMRYRGDTYSIAPYSSSSSLRKLHQRDHTIEILSVLNQLIGLNREAKDIQTTPSVRVIP